jgi:hypothetical protein
MGVARRCRKVSQEGVARCREVSQGVARRCRKKVSQEGVARRCRKVSRDAPMNANRLDLVLYSSLYSTSDPINNPAVWNHGCRKKVSQEGVARRCREARCREARCREAGVAAGCRGGVSRRGVAGCRKQGVPRRTNPNPNLY